MQCCIHFNKYIAISPAFKLTRVLHHIHFQNTSKRISMFHCYIFPFVSQPKCTKSSKDCPEVPSLSPWPLSSSNLDSMEKNKNLVIFSGWFQTCSKYFSCCWVANSWLVVQCAQLEKYDGLRQWGWDDIPYMKWKIINPNVWNHQPDSCFHSTSWNKGIFFTVLDKFFWENQHPDFRI